MIWVQQYYRSTDEPGEKVIRREASKHGVPPGRLKLVSPYDPGARYSEKRGKGWAGYKARISETCCEPEPDGTRQAPNLITSVGHHRGDRARRGDDRAHPRHAGGCRAGPRRARGRCRVHLRRPATRRPRPRHHPARPAAVRQPAAGPLRRIHRRDVHHRLGPPASDLPQGATSTGWSQVVQQGKRQAIVVRFATATCRACPARAQCTTSRTGRQLFLRPREICEAVAAARAGQSSQHWKHRYNIRAGVEGTMRQATHVTGIRRARYLGRGSPEPSGLRIL